MTKKSSNNNKITAEDKWRVMREARRSSLRYSSKVIFWTLVDYFNFNDQYVFYHTEEQIAEDSNSTPKTVISSLKELEEGDWIKVERRKRHANFYWINWWKTVEVKNFHFNGKVDVKDLPVDVKDLPVDVKDLPVDVKDLPVDVKELPYKQVTLTSESNKRIKQEESFVDNEKEVRSGFQEEASSPHQFQEEASSPHKEEDDHADALLQEIYAYVEANGRNNADITSQMISRYKAFYPNEDDYPPAHHPIIEDIIRMRRGEPPILNNQTNQTKKPLVGTVEEPNDEGEAAAAEAWKDYQQSKKREFYRQERLQ